MPVRTPDPDPSEDDGPEGRDRLSGMGASYGRSSDPRDDGSFGSPTAGSAANPGWLSEVELAEARGEVHVGAHMPGHGPR